MSQAVPPLSMSWERRRRSIKTGTHVHAISTNSETPPNYMCRTSCVSANFNSIWVTLAVASQATWIQVCSRFCASSLSTTEIHSSRHVAHSRYGVEDSAYDGRRGLRRHSGREYEEQGVPTSRDSGYAIGGQSGGYQTSGNDCASRNSSYHITGLMNCL